MRTPHSDSFENIHSVSNMLRIINVLLALNQGTTKIWLEEAKDARPLHVQERDDALGNDGRAGQQGDRLGRKDAEMLQRGLSRHGDEVWEWG